MSNGWKWAACYLFALCLIGSVAWPLWSENDVWMLGFGALAAIVAFPIILWPSFQRLRSVFAEAPQGDDTHR